jgi:hypothetical protein
MLLIMIFMSRLGKGVCTFMRVEVVISYIDKLNQKLFHAGTAL